MKPHCIQPMETDRWLTLLWPALLQAAAPNLAAVPPGGAEPVETVVVRPAAYISYRAPAPSGLTGGSTSRIGGTRRSRPPSSIS